MDVSEWLACFVMHNKTGCPFLNDPRQCELVQRGSHWCKSPPVWPWITQGLSGVERSRATDAASSEARGMPAEPSGLLSRVAAGLSRGVGHSARPNAGCVSNAVANSMRSGVAGSTPVKNCVRRSSSGNFAMLAAILRALLRGYYITQN